MDPLNLTVLALNAGSSSLKASLYSFGGGDLPVDPVAPTWTVRRPGQAEIEPLLQQALAVPTG